MYVHVVRAHSRQYLVVLANLCRNIILPEQSRFFLNNGVESYLAIYIQHLLINLTNLLIKKSAIKLVSALSITADKSCDAVSFSTLYLIYLNVLILI